MRPPLSLLRLLAALSLALAFAGAAAFGLMAAPAPEALSGVPPFQDDDGDDVDGDDVDGDDGDD